MAGTLRAALSATSIVLSVCPPHGALSLAREVAARNITVNAIAPGFIDTEILDLMSPEILEAAIKLVPLARKGKPEEVAYAAVFLASDEAAFITGQVLGVDGGMAMM